MRCGGFTLAELLIALVILGVIATFTIPKVLQSQQTSKYNAIAKEAAGMIEGAYTAYKANNTATANTTSANLTQYMNYIAYDTSTVIDDFQGAAATTCQQPGSGYPCLLLANGARLQYDSFEGFGGTATTNALWFKLDSDGKVTNGGSGDTSANAPGKSVEFILYYNNRLTTNGAFLPNTADSYGSWWWGPCGACDPPWFSWN